MLHYFIIEGTETTSRKQVIEAVSGTKVDLAYHPETKLWLPREEVDNWNNIVRNWDGYGQSRWIQQVAEPLAQAIGDATEGYAFDDNLGEFADFPTVYSPSHAFRKFGLVFVPAGIVDPRSQEILVGDDGADSIWEDDSATEEPVVIVAEEPSLLSSLAKWALVVAAGGAAWYVAHRAASKYI